MMYQITLNYEGETGNQWTVVGLAFGVNKHNALNNFFKTYKKEQVKRSELGFNEERPPNYFDTYWRRRAEVKKHSEHGWIKIYHGFVARRVEMLKYVDTKTWEGYGCILWSKIQDITRHYETTSTHPFTGIKSYSMPKIATVLISHFGHCIPALEECDV